MALVLIPDECTGCKSCASTCPEGAISMDLESFNLVIDPKLCTECGACQSQCPAGCIQAPQPS